MKHLVNLCVFGICCSYLPWWFMPVWLLATIAVSTGLLALVAGGSAAADDSSKPGPQG